MSLKINAFVADAALAAGVTATATNPIVDSLLSTTLTTALHSAEISDATGKVLVFATVDNAGTPVTRAVADSYGNIKLFTNSLSAIKFARSVNLAPGAVVSYVAYHKPISVGDPLEGLKSRYKSACAKQLKSAAKLNTVTAKLNNAAAFGWDVSTGATLAEYNDIVSRVATITEWAGSATTLTNSLAQMLITAGVDPLTVVPTTPVAGSN